MQMMELGKIERIVSAVGSGVATLHCRRCAYFDNARAFLTFPNQVVDCFCGSWEGSINFVIVRIARAFW